MKVLFVLCAIFFYCCQEQPKNETATAAAKVSKDSLGKRPAGKSITQGNMTISELEMKSTDQHGGNETVMNASYKCDGKLLYMDLSGLLQGRMQGSDIETSGLPFPLDVSVGDTLADADYTIVMRTD